ncbi:alpha-L-arabinofuranosidase II [Westerdykella ornata]|uniref:Alpha-L-arabinofuranosidase II n=1 Tax=Westerdykella ornata TaxID=318751 RepID=A0A6A6JIU0_WESOR|nr:alpha-L-arabinofuranosidase II [Westerdykella ornata]KAF2276570.1 alpha-L-arabinofuranosidase II [Westerdykella ornata]
MENTTFPDMHLQMPRSYNDVILNITETTTPDPYVIFDNGTYYMTFTAGDRIEIWSADSLFNFESRSHKVTIWRPPPSTPYSGDIWAPELHSLQGRWYVYFAADDPRTLRPNHSHRMYVLEGPPSSESPLQPEKWTFHGRVDGLPEDQWAIDGTVIHLHGHDYFVYSGWPLGVVDTESKQELFIARMTTPTSCVPHTQRPPTRISTPNYQWEYSGTSGINEGPQLLVSPDGGRWVGLVYSCAGSWTAEYKMAVLEYVGGDPCVEGSWRKWPEPLLTCKRDGRPPYGPGHGNFVCVGGEDQGREVWGVFHATDARTGWEGRRARVMRVGWGPKGPYMGRGECGVAVGDVEGFLYGGNPGVCSVLDMRPR